MTALEVVLVICGIICVIVSFILGDREQRQEQKTTGEVSVDLTQQQKELIKQQVNEVIDEELQNLGEKTEASLDKISNTKILEMNEYAETIMGEINRNHNETVFLYDMLNEKAKEVKSTVKNVNMAKRQVEKIQAEVTVSATEQENPMEGIEYMNGNEVQEKAARDDAKERLAQLVNKSNEKIRQSDNKRKRNVQAENLDTIVKAEKKSAAAKKKSVKKEESTEEKATPLQETHSEPAQMSIQFDKSTNNNEKILELYRLGMNNKEIAKELNLGVGEVKLVIDLYNSGNA
jgi:hypothetical protein